MYIEGPMHLTRTVGRRVIYTTGWSEAMSDMPKGEFSANLFTLQLQLKHLLEGVGGEAAIALLDSLAMLSGSEQKVVLKMFANVVAKISNGEQRLVSEVDQALNDFEDSLYRDVLAGMQEAAVDPSASGPKLEVLPGGRCASIKKAPLDLNKARKSRKQALKTVLN